MGLRSVLSKKFRVCTTDSNHTFALADNVLNRDFTSKQLGEKMGFLYYIYKSWQSMELPYNGFRFSR